MGWIRIDEAWSKKKSAEDAILQKAMDIGKCVHCFFCVLKHLAW